jgi:hypothetical protein
MPDPKSNFQLIWGVLLALAGIGLLFRIPQIMPQIRQIEQFVAVIPLIYFCFYFMAALLIAGGARKIYSHIRRK